MRAELFRTARPALLAAARRRVAPDVAEDLVQETLLAYLDRPPAREPVTYMHGILRHLIARHHRQSSRECRTRALQIPTSQPPRWIEPALERAVRKLPDEQASILLRHTVVGWTTRELASQTSMSRGRLVRELHRARESVRNALA
ncbi:MAG: sigma-70 family RNA polymerase sigma factor [Deltaproteobacteria bacterium]|nr:sigma-70 family RNA polymerase sigma factor [Deltaproteobacteria bacterium]